MKCNGTSSTHSSRCVNPTDGEQSRARAAQMASLVCGRKLHPWWILADILMDIPSRPVNPERPDVPGAGLTASSVWLPLYSSSLFLGIFMSLFVCSLTPSKRLSFLFWACGSLQLYLSQVLWEGGRMLNEGKLPSRSQRGRVVAPAVQLCLTFLGFIFSYVHICGERGYVLMSALSTEARRRWWIS